MARTPRIRTAQRLSVAAVAVAISAVAGGCSSLTASEISVEGSEPTIAAGTGSPAVEASTPGPGDEPEVTADGGTSPADRGSDPSAPPDPPARPSLEADVIVTRPAPPEGERGAPGPSEAAALACADVELAIDAWEGDDPAGYQARVERAAVLASNAPEPPIRSSAGALTQALTATDPAPAITEFLDACVRVGYAL
jgi:hypothetical protein